MNTESRVYLLVNGGKWWNEKQFSDGMLRIVVRGEASPLVKTESDMQSFDGTSWLIPNSSPLVLCYQEPEAIDDEGRANNARCRRTVQALLEKYGTIRVFYHRGGDFTTLTEVQDAFHKHFWERADVMPHSLKNLGFPWIALIHKAKTTSHCDEAAFGLLYEQLELAWDMAFTYYHFGQPMRAVLNATFPLYVDVANHQINALSELEFGAALVAAKIDLETQLRMTMGTGDDCACNRFKKCLEAIKDQQTTKECASLGLAMLTALEGLKLDNRDDFLKAFKALSASASTYFDPTTVPAGPTPTSGAFV